jgi:hypothetical protein
MVALVDSSIVIDLLRGYAPARTWFLAQDAIGVALYTRNLKHFQPLLAALAQAPY